MTSIKELARAASGALGIDIVIVGRRAAHYADETRQGYWLSRGDLVRAQKFAGIRDGYSLWCSGTTPQQMAKNSRVAVFGK